jgi:hypothetical protein
MVVELLLFQVLDTREARGNRSARTSIHTFNCCASIEDFEAIFLSSTLLRLVVYEPVPVDRQDWCAVHYVYTIYLLAYEYRTYISNFPALGLVHSQAFLSK